MSKILIDNAGFETRAAIVAEGRLEHFEIERSNLVSLAGNIYKGRVIRVLRSLNAAFLNVGETREVFLPLTDIREDSPYQEEVTDEAPQKNQRHSRLKVKPKDHVLVQVVKDAIGTKAPKVTASHISLAGFLLVLLPQAGERRGISHRITASGERERLLKIAGEAMPPEFGFIIRTSADGCNERIFHAEIGRMVKEWQEISAGFKRKDGPNLLHSEQHLQFRIIRDYFTKDVDEILIEAPAFLKPCRRYAAESGADARKIHLFREKTTLFKKFGVDEAIEKVLSRKVALKGGGYLIIEETEALCAIDVNSGRTGGEDYRSMVLRTNLLAADEIAWQLRLRNLGGLVVVDFIDMERAEDRRTVYKTFEKALEPDKARIKVLKVSRLGLIEMTRQRTRESLRDYLVDDCPVCRGDGVVSSAATVASQLRRLLQVEIEQKETGFLARVNPRKPRINIKVSLQFEKYLKENLNLIFPERSYQGRLNLIPDPTLSSNQFKIDPDSPSNR